MSQHNNATDFSTLNISTNPLTDFQAKTDELIAQANAQLQHPNIDTTNQPGHHQVPDEPLLPQQTDNTMTSNPLTCPGRIPLPNSH